MKQLMACLTFDFDAMSGLVARGMTTPTPVSRGEFGAVAVPRILELLKRHQIKSSFFVPGVVIGTYPQLCERIVAEGHELGNHGWTHMPPASLPPGLEEEGLIRGNEAIFKLTGKNPAGYRSPSWDLSDHTVGFLLRHGFLYESSMMANDHEPYRVRQGDVVHTDQPMEFGKETSLVEMPISWSLDDFPHFGCLEDRIFYAVGYGGRGVALTSLLGKLLAGLVQNETIDAGPLNSGRFGPIPFHRWRIPGMQAIAGYYWLLDKLER